jgi:hypothetical protein
MTTFWIMAPCSLVYVDRRFRDAYCLNRQGGQRHAPTAFNPGECTLDRRLASELVFTEMLAEKFFVFAGNRTPIVQSAVRHYYD